MTLSTLSTFTAIRTFTNKPSYFCIDDKSIPAHQLAASVLDFSHSRQVNKDKLLRGTGIFSQDLISDKKLSSQQLLKLLNNAQDLTPGNDSAFLLGNRLFPSNYGAISNALMHSRNLSDMLNVLAVLRSQICPFFSANAYTTAHRHYLLITDTVGCKNQLQFLCELYFSALVSATKLIFGQRIPFQFDFPFARPKYIQEYEVHLGHRLNFSQPMLSISFDKKCLSTPNQHSSENLKWHAIKQAKHLPMPKQGFLEAVRRHLTAQHNMGLQHIADLFDMSPATFKRKLKQHGVSFQQLQDELGKQQALFLLQIQQLSNEQSANLMHFNDISNFRRSVKRWTGLTPSQLRLTFKN
ncbi:AraC family transcriptional regulator [Paraglaciecola aquimarina]|uniref:AraC family transcriptional regulator n=1 Tax=Paraglaciecola algarum TaxID=3050085 RepID=A0ABS9D1N8_9ALTE|nr:AraC family transcriptional regulator [Paraglaciecola sp. G1-23]MCF2946829.1 AraC family transcriptional regulator [Paraglaciecola sp. G1-23]